MCNLCVNDETCAECGAEPGKECMPYCLAPVSPGAPHEYDHLTEEISAHPQVAAARAALTRHGITAIITAADSGGWHLAVPRYRDETVIIIGAPEDLPEDREPIPGWVINHIRRDGGDFIAAPYYAPENPDPAPMAAAVAAYIAAL